MKGICADALLCDSLSCQSLRLVVEARYIVLMRKGELQKKKFKFFTHNTLRNVFICDRYLPLPKDREEYSLKWV